ncbi:MAG: type I-E CRISPR-associated protein Cas7/Cse4/CasC [Promethearchaeota archaeon]
MLVEIHMLQNHAPANLNRDDSNSPKDCIFGGYRRARISSQCLKRTIRLSPFFKEAIEELGIRSRHFPSLLEERLIEKGMDPQAAAVIEKIFESLGGKSGGSGGGKDSSKKSSSKITKQIIFFSNAEIDTLADKIIEEVGSETNSKNINKIFKEKIKPYLTKNPLKQLTPDMALFGRMVTDDMFLDIDSAIQVAHAISTNKMEQEIDFFVAVDDIDEGTRTLGTQGSAMMGDIEFTSATFYKYFAIDTDAYLDNLTLNTEDEDEIEDIKRIVVKSIVGFLKGAIYTNPSGKQNTFAAHQLPSAILIEVKDKKIPVSYANAFVLPVHPYGDKDLIAASIEKFNEHVNLLTTKYKLNYKKRLWFCERDSMAPNDVDICGDIDELAKNLEETLTESI